MSGWHRSGRLDKLPTKCSRLEVRGWKDRRLRLEGVSALVSGGASGLGLATAEILTEARAKVTILDLPGAAGADIAKRLGNATVVAGDVRHDGDVPRAVNAAGNVRVAVSCAGSAAGIEFLATMPAFIRPSRTGWQTCSLRSRALTRSPTMLVGRSILRARCRGGRRSLMRSCPLAGSSRCEPSSSCD
jgi:NADPH:quinone reductase-like Zn-dependent oxidoreductase